MVLESLKKRVKKAVRKIGETSERVPAPFLLLIFSIMVTIIPAGLLFVLNDYVTPNFGDGSKWGPVTALPKFFLYGAVISIALGSLFIGLWVLIPISIFWIVYRAAKKTYRKARGLPAFDPYDVLKLKKPAGKEEIEAAYHKLFHKYNKYKWFLVKNKMRDLNRAYEMLMEQFPEKKAEYEPDVRIIKRVT